MIQKWWHQISNRTQAFYTFKISKKVRIFICIFPPCRAVSQKCTNQRLVYQSAYPGVPLPKRPTEASRTNRHALVQKKYCYLPSLSGGVSKEEPISIWCTNQHLVYQSAYPDTPLSERLFEVSRTNRHNLGTKKHCHLPVIHFVLVLFEVVRTVYNSVVYTKFNILVWARNRTLSCS